jgi:hypothetical protein
MTNQFFYTRTEGDKEYAASFNVNKIIFTIEKDDGAILIVLDDIHERVFETDIRHPKTGNKTGGVTRKRETVQTEIILSGDDVTRFKNLTQIV